MIIERQKYKTLPPAMWQPEEDLSDPPAGYGFTPDSMPELEVFFFHTDHLGSTSYLTDSAGSVCQFVCYTPYGEAFVDEHSTSYENPFKFSGKELDDVTGLYDHGARSRDPKTSLWLGVDSRYEDFTEYSPYNYCLGNPVIMHDPDGEMPWVVVVALIGGAVNAGITYYEGGSAEEVGAAFVGGAVSGALAATGMGLVSGVVSTSARVAIAAGVGAVSSAAGNASEQGINIATDNQSEFSVSEVVTSGAVGAVVGSAGEALNIRIEGKTIEAIEEVAKSAKQQTQKIKEAVDISFKQQKKQLNNLKAGKGKTYHPSEREIITMQKEAKNNAAKLYKKPNLEKENKRIRRAAYVKKASVEAASGAVNNRLPKQMKKSE